MAAVIGLCAAPRVGSALQRPSAKRQAAQLRDARCKAGDNHCRPVFAAAAASEPAEDSAWNPYDASNCAHAETARFSVDLTEFWVSEGEEELPAPAAPMSQEPDFMHIWGHKSAVCDAETSRNSLDSCDFFME